MAVNRVILIGNTGKDPEVRHLEGGASVCTIPLATTETYKNRNGERVSNTEWHNVVLWRGLADVAEKYVKKGDRIYVEGKIRTRTWDDKEGNKRYTTEIVADNMVMLGGKPGRGDDSGEPSGGNDNKDYNEPDTLQDPPDDLPF